MLYLASFAVLILGLQAQDEADPGLVSEGGGCNAGDDPCFECFACNEYGRCTPVDGCIPSCYSDDDCTRMQVCVDTVCQLPGGAPKDDPDRSTGGFGERRARSKGTGSRGSSNPMGECQYDGSLGYNTDSQTYEAECMRLSMAECMTAGPRGRCTYVPAEGSAIGCTWDGTGCSEGCSPANMESRCSALSHDQAACEGYDGQEMRCKWSKAGADAMGMAMEGETEGEAAGVPDGESEGISMFDKVGLFSMGSEMSSRDIFLVVLLAVTGVIGLYQLYRWCINWKLHREYKLVNTSDPAPRSNHCIIDGQAYF